MQSLPLGKDGVLSGGAKAKPAKFLSLLLEVTKTKVCSCFYSSFYVSVSQLQMEAKVKGTLSYSGKTSDFWTSKGAEAVLVG